MHHICTILIFCIIPINKLKNLSLISFTPLAFLKLFFFCLKNLKNKNKENENQNPNLLLLSLSEIINCILSLFLIFKNISFYYNHLKKLNIVFVTKNGMLRKYP